LCSHTASSGRTAGEGKRKRKVEPDTSIDGSAPPEDESSGSDDGDDDDEEPSEDERPAGKKTKTTKSTLKKKVRRRCRFRPCFPASSDCLR
jgi:hypothetical protein